MFGQFKSKLGDEFTTANARRLSAYFNLSPAKLEDIGQSKRPGIELLSILENDEVIGEDIGIGKLCVALDFCSLKRLARIARNTYDTLRKEGADATDVAAVYTGQNLDQLKATLQDQLTRQNCFEIAMFLGLSASFIETIQSSEGPGGELVQTLHDRHMIKESNIGVLVVALRARGLHRVASMVTSGSEAKPPASSGQSQAVAVSESFVPKTSTAGEVISECICGSGDFDELVSLRSEMISIQCCACNAEWLKASSSSGEGITLLRNDIKFSYKIPLRIDEAELKHVIVKDVKHLKPGDHIVMRRLETWDHHAIFILESNGRMQVIHWTTNILNKLKAPTNPGVKFAEIKFEWKEFPEEVRRVLYPKEDPPHLVTARAYTLYQSKGHHHYSLTVNNCETLSTYCKIGKGFSMQADVVRDVLPPVQEFIKSLIKQMKLIFT